MSVTGGCWYLLYLLCSVLLSALLARYRKLLLTKCQVNWSTYLTRGTRSVSVLCLLSPPYAAEGRAPSGSYACLSPRVDEHLLLAPGFVFSTQALVRRKRLAQA